MVTAQPELAKALAAVQQELPQIGKQHTADAGTYSYEYADLTDITAALMPILGKHGLSFLAKPTLGYVEGQTGVVQFVLSYSLLHVSGEREDGLYPLPMGGSPQSIGSAISYGRRYCLCAVTGVAPGGSDDDGVAAAAVVAAPEPSKADMESAAAEAALTAAKNQLASVWRVHHDGQLDVEELMVAYEEFAAAPLADAGVNELRSFRLHLASQPAETTEPTEEKATTDE
jgi:hypothetical protein